MPSIKEKKISISKGNNLFNILIKEGIDSKEIGNLLNSLKKIYNPKRIRPDQEIFIAFEKNNLYGLSIGVNELREIQVINTPYGFKEYILRNL